MEISGLSGLVLKTANFSMKWEPTFAWWEHIPIACVGAGVGRALLMGVQFWLGAIDTLYESCRLAFSYFKESDLSLPLYRVELALRLWGNGVLNLPRATIALCGVYPPAFLPIPIFLALYDWIRPPRPIINFLPLPPIPNSGILSPIT